MARKFGKKNVIKIDPLAYNTAIIGESGIGKTTLAKRVCEKLVGEDGYIIANVGKEDGIDAIAGAIYEDIPDWDTFEDFCDEIVENKLEDYADLRVIVWDTIDELIRVAEPESIRLYNREQNAKSGKTAKTIKQAWGGFGEGEKYTINLIMDKLWELKKAGVKMFLLGHTKTRTKSDPVTGQDYDMLTTNMSYSYFNAFKTKLHFLGVASIDREIVKEKTGKKNIVTNKDIVKGKISSEVRKITFRDDNFSIDSKSRFEEIVEEIPLDADMFIEAITDAIKKESQKEDDVNKNKSDEEKYSEQKEAEMESIQEAVDKKKKEADAKRLKEIQSILTDFIKENRSNKEIMKPIALKMKELECSSPAKLESLEQAKELLSLIEG